MRISHLPRWINGETGIMDTASKRNGINEIGKYKVKLSNVSPVKKSVKISLMKRSI